MRHIDGKLLEQLAEHLRFYRQLGVEWLNIERVAPPSRSEPAPQSETEFARPDKAEVERKIEAKPEPPAPRPASGLLFELGVKPRSPFDGLPDNETLDLIRESLGDCRRCKLCLGRKTIVFGQGNPRAELMFIGEAPGAEEDEQGLAFVGRAGQLLTRIIEAIEMRREEVYITNVVKCRPPENRKPEEDEMAACEPFLLRQINAIGPKVICLLGGVAAQALLKTKEPISRLRGKWIDYHGYKVIATYHPAYLLRNPNDKRLVWADMQKVRDYLQGKSAG